MKQAKKKAVNKESSSDTPNRSTSTFSGSLNSPESRALQESIESLISTCKYDAGEENDIQRDLLLLNILEHIQSPDNERWLACNCLPVSLAKVCEWVILHGRTNLQPKGTPNDTDSSNLLHLVACIAWVVLHAACIGEVCKGEDQQRQEALDVLKSCIRNDLPAIFLRSALCLLTQDLGDKGSLECHRVVLEACSTIMRVVSHFLFKNLTESIWPEAKSWIEKSDFLAAVLQLCATLTALIEDLDLNQCLDLKCDTPFAAILFNSSYVIVYLTMHRIGSLSQAMAQQHLSMYVRGHSEYGSLPVSHWEGVKRLAWELLDIRAIADSKPLELLQIHLSACEMIMQLNGVTSVQPSPSKRNLLLCLSNALDCHMVEWHKTSEWMGNNKDKGELVKESSKGLNAMLQLTMAISLPELITPANGGSSDQLALADSDPLALTDPDPCASTDPDPQSDLLQLQLLLSNIRKAVNLILSSTSVQSSDACNLLVGLHSATSVISELSVTRGNGAALLLLIAELLPTAVASGIKGMRESLDHFRQKEKLGPLIAQLRCQGKDINDCNALWHGRSSLTHAARSATLSMQCVINACGLALPTSQWKHASASGVWAFDLVLALSASGVIALMEQAGECITHFLPLAISKLKKAPQKTSRIPPPEAQSNKQLRGGGGGRGRNAAVAGRGDLEMSHEMMPSVEEDQVIVATTLRLLRVSSDGLIKFLQLGQLAVDQVVSDIKGHPNLSLDPAAVLAVLSNVLCASIEASKLFSRAVAKDASQVLFSPPECFSHLLFRNEDGICTPPQALERSTKFLAQEISLGYGNLCHEVLQSTLTTLTAFLKEVTLARNSSGSLISPCELETNQHGLANQGDGLALSGEGLPCGTVEGLQSLSKAADLSEGIMIEISHLVAKTFQDEPMFGVDDDGAGEAFPRLIDARWLQDVSDHVDFASQRCLLLSALLKKASFSPSWESTTRQETIGEAPGHLNSVISQSDQQWCYLKAFSENWDFLQLALLFRVANSGRNLDTLSLMVLASSDVFDDVVSPDTVQPHDGLCAGEGEDDAASFSSDTTQPLASSMIGDADAYIFTQDLP